MSPVSAGIGRPLKFQRCTQVNKTDAHTGRYQKRLRGGGLSPGGRRPCLGRKRPRLSISLTAVFATAKTPPRGRACARRPSALPQTLCVLGFLYRSRQFSLKQKRLRGGGLSPGGLWPCLGRSASSVYEDTSSLWLFGWRKTVEGSALYTVLRNRCPYRQVSGRYRQVLS